MLAMAQSESRQPQGTTQQKPLRPVGMMIACIVSGVCMSAPILPDWSSLSGKRMIGASRRIPLCYADRASSLAVAQTSGLPTASTGPPSTSVAMSKSSDDDKPNAEDTEIAERAEMRERREFHDPFCVLCVLRDLCVMASL